MLKKFILIFVILCSLVFYYVIFLPEFSFKPIRLLGIAVLLVFIVIYFIYSKEKLGRMHFALPITLIFVSVLISMFGANLFQDQSLMVTALAQQVIYYYLIYFLLHFFKIPIEYIKKIILAFAIVYMVLYYAQHALYPLMLTHSKMFFDRGTLRISLPGAGFIVIGYYMWLYLTFKSFKVKYLVLLLATFGIFILLASRQVIGAILLITIIFLFQSKVVKSKFLFFLLIGAAVIPVYFIFEDIINSMFNVTVSQGESFDSYIRVKAARFFLSDFYNHKLAYFTGNGAEGSSEYGSRIIKYARRYGYYQSDLGLIGEYTKFGALYVIGVIMIFFRAFRAKLPEDLMFVKYNFFGILLTLVVGAGAFGTSADNILINSMLLYVTDVYLNEKGSSINTNSS